MDNIFQKGLLRYLTEKQFTTIQSRRIGIGGAGGLGSNCAVILVRTGFTNIEILDYDVIDPSNLNRQQYYHDEIGLSKIDVLIPRLKAINPDLRIVGHKDKWTPETGNNYFKGCDFIIEAFDQADWKYKFVEYYQDKSPIVISGVGMAGLLEKKPMTIRKVGNIYFVGDCSTDTRAGHPPMAPRVTQCAAMMAEVVLDLTLNPSLYS
jgi:sulfur carrier protein ThiS adenylyltransferase